MDNTKMNTQQVVDSGVLSRPMPKTDIPTDREEYDFDLESVDEEALALALDSGQILVCREYYGIPYAWKDGNSFKVRLLQYREVTESDDFDAVAEAVDWFVETSRKVAG